MEGSPPPRQEVVNPRRPRLLGHWFRVPQKADRSSSRGPRVPWEASPGPSELAGPAACQRRTRSVEGEHPQPRCQSISGPQAPHPHEKHVEQPKMPISFGSLLDLARDGVQLYVRTRPPGPGRPSVVGPSSTKSPSRVGHRPIRLAPTRAARTDTSALLCRGHNALVKVLPAVSRAAAGQRSVASTSLHRL